VFGEEGDERAWLDFIKTFTQELILRKLELFWQTGVKAEKELTFFGQIK
jgi:hypothetical protein